ncbi:hypothetical protein [Arthrobacter sp. MDT1-65]
MGLLRERGNGHDAHGVALTTGRPPVTVGYVEEQGAPWVAELLKGGRELEALVLRAEPSPRVLAAAPALLTRLGQE